MRFRIEIFNSVEGSCRLMAVAGWLRFVCSNGLIVGTTLAQVRRQHRQQLVIEDLERVLKEALESADVEKQTFKEWLETPIDHDVIIDWIDSEVGSQWGIKAAVRVLGVVTSGYDVKPVGNLANVKPSGVETENLEKVPGINGPVGNLFGVSQALTWIAGSRLDLSQDLEWRSEVPNLMTRLAKQTHRARRNGGR